MADVLIRNLSAEDVSGLDEAARRLGISRAELLRRHVQELARVGRRPSVTKADLVVMSELAVDLADDEVMGEAWR